MFFLQAEPSSGALAQKETIIETRVLLELPYRERRRWVWERKLNSLYTSLGKMQSSQLTLAGGGDVWFCLQSY